MKNEFDAELQSEAPPQPEPISQPCPGRIPRRILTAIGSYTVLLVTLLNVFRLGSGKPIDRAVILMADGLILFWIVMLLFGSTGSIAEARIQPSNLIGGFWVFVYGLVVYLPACTVPEDRPAKQPRWWCYPPAVVLPCPFIVLAAPVVLLREWLGIEFLPGV